VTTQIAPANGVDLSPVAALVEKISADPAAAELSFAARTRWTGGVASVTEVREHEGIAVDEPAALAGVDGAPNPVEYLLAALGSCLTVGYVAGATARGIELRSLELELEGTLDLGVFLGLTQGHAGYKRVDVTTTIESDATAEELEALHAHVVKTSPVGHTLTNPIELDVKLATR
jgi:uncharacterized OsmC-like protein